MREIQTNGLRFFFVLKAIELRSVGGSYPFGELAKREWRGIVDVIAIRKDTAD